MAFIFRGKFLIFVFKGLPIKGILQLLTNPIIIFPGDLMGDEMLSGPST